MAVSVFSGSRLAVGSSASTRAGRAANARATATRCCWPTESRSTSASASAIPSVESRARARCSCSAAGIELNISAAKTFSSAVNPCSRLKVWKIIPMLRPRASSRAAPRRVSIRTPATSTDPLPSSRNPATTCSRVLLPRPEPPTSNTCSPASTCKCGTDSAHEASGYENRRSRMVSAGAGIREGSLRPIPLLTERTAALHWSISHPLKPRRPGPTRRHRNA